MNVHSGCRANKFPRFRLNHMVADKEKKHCSLSGFCQIHDLVANTQHYNIQFQSHDARLFVSCIFSTLFTFANEMTLFLQCRDSWLGRRGGVQAYEYYMMYASSWLDRAYCRQRSRVSLKKTNGTTNFSLLFAQFPLEFRLHGL
jgi:hypothetical protein